MHGVKYSPLTTTRIRSHRRGPSCSKHRLPIRRLLRQFQERCIQVSACVLLLLLLSALVLFRGPGAEVSSAFDLGTDESPAGMRQVAANGKRQVAVDESHAGKRQVAADERPAELRQVAADGSEEHDRDEGGLVGQGTVPVPELEAYAGIAGSSLVRPATEIDLGLSGPLQIYVYDLPPSFNTDFLKDPRCAGHLFAAEVAIHQALLQTPVRTLNPEKADFFFLPIYTACDFQTENGFPNLSRAPELLRAAVEHVAAAHPFWNRTRGHDHVIVASHDFGACFHAMEKAAVQAGIPAFLRNSIILQTFGQTDDHPCQQVNHIQIPPYVSPAVALAPWQPVEKQNRTIFAYMSGKIEVHPKESVSGEIYGRGVRTEIWKRFKGDKRFLIRRKRAQAYYQEMLRARFCLCPRGWAPWSPRIVESVLFGCIPVIIADHIKLPFDHVLDWRGMAVVLGENQVPDLAAILEGLTEERIASMQQKLWDADVRRTLMFLQPSVRGDATWQILNALAKKKVERDKATM